MSEKTTNQLITEIVLRGVAKALPNTDAKGVEALANPMIEMIEGLVVGVRLQHTIDANNFRAFCIWNAILDEIEKEIPSIEGKIKVFGTCTREQRKEFYATASRQSTTPS